MTHQAVFEAATRAAMLVRDSDASNPTGGIGVVDGAGGATSGGGGIGRGTFGRNRGRDAAAAASLGGAGATSNRPGGAGVDRKRNASGLFGRKNPDWNTNGNGREKGNYDEDRISGCKCVIL